MIDGGRWFVDARMSDDSHKLVQTRPGNGPEGSAFGGLRQSLIRFRVPNRIRPMSVNQNVCVDSNQSLTRPIYQIPQLLPIPFINAGLEPFAFKCVALQAECVP